MGYICGRSLVMIGYKLRPVSRKKCQFHLNMDIEGQLWRTSRCDVISDVINIKSTFLGIISGDITISDVTINLYKIFRNFQNGRHFEVKANFEPEVVPEVESYIKIDNAIPYISSFW